MTKNASATNIVTAVTNISFSNSNTITGGGSSFGSVSYGDVIEVTGALNQIIIKNLELSQKQTMFLQFVLQMELQLRQKVLAQQ